MSCLAEAEAVSVDVRHRAYVSLNPGQLPLFLACHPGASIRAVT
jgi:hypothetical protein